eukprot:TRINITY_DN12291_c0_g1_i1.p1 TRINITY_DN12291_c0_g1~~TRINITY_DN12291_c0_g1_i1.p1  ORF type:complete len:302 (+),score=36.32 TRINITY_DN12291_c0_g1_i1:161-1066(+)
MVGAPHVAGDTSQTRRIHGFSRPFRIQTIVSFAVFFATGLVAALVLTPLLEDSLARLAFGLPFWLSWFVLGVSSLAVMLSDPADPSIHESPGEPEEGKPWCALCRAVVRPDSKHCWECNVCIGHFDHHCPWLNSCIGAKNYCMFLVVVTSAMISLMSTFMAAAVLLARLLAAGEERAAWCGSFPLCQSKEASTGILVAVLLLYSPVLCSVFSLVAFHCFICYKGLTTYEYLRGPRPALPPVPAPGAAASAAEEALPSRPAAATPEKRGSGIVGQIRSFWSCWRDGAGSMVAWPALAPQDKE